MKRIFYRPTVFNALSVLFGAVAFAGLFAGCGGKPHASQEAATEAFEAPAFSVKKGLQLPEATRRSLDLKIVDVTEQKVTATLDLQLRVYQGNGATAFASSMVTPEEANRLTARQPVQVRITESNTIPARISKVNNHLEKAAGLVEVLVEIPNPPRDLAIGGFLHASLSLDSAENVVTIPRAALLQCSDGPSVYTVSGDSLVRTPVKIGAINHEFVEIKDGLYAGDQVALQPVMSLWLTELAAIKGGQACCIEPPKGK
ncbi:MAG: hypothetical protein L0Z50_29825 [Verrucomicrobiales bacterium]|nr:hypothetical protein [Verrucomicrobiales bacterium]